MAIGDSSYDTIGRMAAMKAMSIGITERRMVGNIKLFIERSLVEVCGGLGEHSLAWYEFKTARRAYTKRQVAVEWREYCKDIAVAEEDDVLTRVEAIASLASQLSGLSESMRSTVFDCLGFIHEPSRARVGFVYGFPNGMQNPTTLNNILGLYAQDRIGFHPGVGSIFKLAYKIADCLHAVHCVGWLHKNLSSHNIAVFPTSFEANNVGSGSIRGSFVTGFQNNRPDELGQYSVGPNEEGLYRHPSYQPNNSEPEGRGFRRAYDYYGLGLVLLEIGLWKPLWMIRRAHKDLSAELLRQKITKKYVTQLEAFVGEVYQNAVMACLDGSFDDLDMTTGEPDVDLSRTFAERVVQPLENCAGGKTA